MKFAVIKTGGKQYVVREKDKLKIEKLQAEEGDKIDFETLLIADGDKVSLGEPILKERVEAKALRVGRSRKVTGIKYKPKTREKTKYGHKQYFTEIEITKI